MKGKCNHITTKANALDAKKDKVYQPSQVRLMGFPSASKTIDTKVKLGSFGHDSFHGGKPSSRSIIKSTQHKGKTS